MSGKPAKAAAGAEASPVLAATRGAGAGGPVAEPVTWKVRSPGRTVEFCSAATPSSTPTKAHP